MMGAPIKERYLNQLRVPNPETNCDLCLDVTGHKVHKQKHCTTETQANRIHDDWG